MKRAVRTLIQHGIFAVFVVLDNVSGNALKVIILMLSSAACTSSMPLSLSLIQVLLAIRPKFCRCAKIAFLLVVILILFFLHTAVTEQLLLPVFSGFRNDVMMCLLHLICSLDLTCVAGFCYGYQAVAHRSRFQGK